MVSGTSQPGARPYPRRAGLLARSGTIPEIEECASLPTKLANLSGEARGLQIPIEPNGSDGGARAPEHGSTGGTAGCGRKTLKDDQDPGRTSLLAFGVWRTTARNRATNFPKPK